MIANGAENCLARSRRSQAHLTATGTEGCDGIADRLAHGDGQHEGRFAHRLAAVNRILGIGRVGQQTHAEIARHVPDRRNFVGVGRMREQFALAVPDQFLGGEPTHALHETTFDLSAIDTLIDGLSAVVENVDAAHMHVAGETIDLDFADRGTYRKIIKRVPLARIPVPMDLRRAVETRGRETHTLHPGFLHHFCKREVIGRVLHVENAPFAEGYLVLAAGLATSRRKHLRGDGAQARGKLVACILHRHTVHVCPAGGRGGGGVRDLVGRGRHHTNAVRRDTESSRRDSDHVGIDPLPHLRAAVVHLHGAVRVNQHQRTGLIEDGIGEGNAEFHRRECNAALAVRAGCVPGGDLRAAARQIGRRLEFVPDLFDPVVLDLLSVVRRIGLAAAVVEIALAHHFRRKTELPRYAVDDLLDNQHALRTPEAAESGVGNEVRLHHLAAQFDVRDVVAVVRVEHGAVGHRHGKIESPATVGVVRGL